MENIQRQHDKLNNNNSMDHSVLLKQKSIHFISQNRTCDCVDVYHVMENGIRHQIFTVSTEHFLNGLRRSPRILARRQKEEALRELYGSSHSRKHGVNNSSNQSSRNTTTKKSDTGYVSRSPKLLHSGGVGSKAGVTASDISRPLNSVSRCPQRLVGGRDVDLDSNVIRTVSTDKSVDNVYNARLESKSDISEKYESVDPKVKILFDYDFSNIIDIEVL